ncbi:hypothetical protein FA95DRAFT_1552125 [Auriscalpium vulgare]|uniref:Uncharacterized protein n=1 Tax=Auriscalpium vulgare TaxID=40419 RepID=A0ACB8SBR0_9AGAM|nr:hypothetical protein FA95DRAFT_1552125 [Auriscalpium vulgare]
MGPSPLPSLSRPLFALCLFASFMSRSGHAQSISTSTPVPPLQWINLTGLLQGSPAPPLKDPSIGYDESSRSLLIFGGESSGGFPQSQTYLLNLDTLTWSQPVAPTGLGSIPPARSAAIGGGDFAASYRQAHVVIGGKGADGQPLSDVWEFDYNNHFWSSVAVAPGGPARLNAVGGIDTSVPFDPTGSSGPNNTFYMMGGAQSTGSGLGAVPLSQTWRLEISGTLSSNLPNSVVATWVQQTIDNRPAVSGEGGTVVKEQLVSYGGCTSTVNPNASCAQQGAYVMDVSRGNSIAPDPCAAPRIGAVVVPNQSGVSSSFDSQVFVLLGLFDSSAWNDGGGSTKGEVDVLDIQAGTWARVLPAGDPGSGGSPTFPSPREGAAAIAIPSAFVGSSRASSADALVFGGRDASGNYLSDMWLLRAYNASVSQSGQKWAGFGNGQLQTGIDAAGQGVTVQYLTSCVSPLNKPQSSAPATHSASPSSTRSSPTPSSSSQIPPASRSSQHAFDTSVVHKVLAPVSLVLLLPAILLYRLSLPTTTSIIPDKSVGFKYTCLLAVVVAYGVGLAGLATSFTSTTRQQSNDTALTKRASPDTVLKTTHGRAGLALFVALYGVMPILFLLHSLGRRMFVSVRTGKLNIRPERRRANSTDTAEKLNSFRQPMDGVESSAAALSQATSPLPDTTPRSRLHSWGKSSLLNTLVGRRSTETDTAAEAIGAPSTHAFEVVNRPVRTRHHSTSGTINLSESSHRMPRNLSELSWLDRRRSVHAVGELDYALTQIHNQGLPPTPATAEVLAPELPTPAQRPLMPPLGEAFLRALLHALVLGLCVLTLIALWLRAPRATFGLFLAWTVAFYVILVALAWRGRPQTSTLTTLLSRLRGDAPFVPVPTRTPLASRAMSMTGTTDQLLLMPDPRGPYLHQPPFHIAHEDDLLSTSHASPRSEEGVDSDDDEDARQRRIEDEMGRRDVSIVTVPKRKLWITNPS